MVGINVVVVRVTQNHSRIIHCTNNSSTLCDSVSMLTIINAHAHTHTHTYARACTHTYTHTHIHMREHTHMRERAHTHTRIHTHTPEEVQQPYQSAYQSGHSNTPCFLFGLKKR